MKIQRYTEAKTFLPSDFYLYENESVENVKDMYTHKMASNHDKSFFDNQLQARYEILHIASELNISRHDVAKIYNYEANKDYQATVDYFKRTKHCNVIETVTNSGDRATIKYEVLEVNAPSQYDKKDGDAFLYMRVRVFDKSVPLIYGYDDEESGYLPAESSLSVISYIDGCCASLNTERYRFSEFARDVLNAHLAT